MALGPVIAVPAAPLLLPAATPTPPPLDAAAVDALRADSRAALSALATVDVVVLMAGGSEPLVHDADVATLSSYGVAGTDTTIETDLELLVAIAARGQASRLRSERLDGDLAVLALQVAAARPDVPVVPVTVAGLANAAALGGVAAGLVGAVAAVGRRVGIVAAGDLAATLDQTSPGYLVDGASGWDAAACAALRTCDLDAMGALGPDDAARFQARGWAPLTVMLTIAAARSVMLGTASYHVTRGVGAVVVATGEG